MPNCTLSAGPVRNGIFIMKLRVMWHIHHHRQRQGRILPPPPSPICKVCRPNLVTCRQNLGYLFRLISAITVSALISVAKTPTLPATPSLDTSIPAKYLPPSARHLPVLVGGWPCGEEDKGDDAIDSRSYPHPAGASSGWAA